MRLKESKQDDIVEPLSFCVVDRRVGDGEIADAVLEVDDRAVPREIIEPAGPGQCPHLRGAQPRLQLAYHEAPYAVDVYPGTEAGHDVGLVKLRYGIVQSKAAYPHSSTPCGLGLMPDSFCHGSPFMNSAR